VDLTDSERRMLDGTHGKARQKAMELLVRYAEALGAERFVDTRNVAGVPGSANPFLQNDYQDKSADGRDAIFSFFDLDADELIDVPDAVVPTYHLQGGADPTAWQTLGVKVEVFRNYEEREKFAAQHDVGILKTCTPYLAGNVPTKGEHLAWMESSAVIYANSVLGARTNTEGRESTSAAMLTGKIPDWGLHRTEHRYGTHRIDVEIPIASVMDWGMLGYFVGDVVQERIPVLRGDFSVPTSSGSNTSARQRRARAASRCITSSASRRKPRRSRWRSALVSRSRRLRTAPRSVAAFTIDSTPTRAIRMSTT
jgi:predicted aconitase